MRFHAVSTFNRGGLDLYGKRMVETFAWFWPADVDLTIYSEGWSGPLDPAEVVDLAGASPWLASFKQRNSHRRFKDYRWDAVRFSHKVAAVCHAALINDADILIWIDGDVITHSTVTMSDLAGLAPKEEWIAWLDRETVYPECGFYMLNMRHPRHREMIGRLSAMYEDDLLYRLDEWHDSYVLQRVVEQAEVGRKSLSGAGWQTSHPMVNGPLGKWFDHAKGRRKHAGRTPKSELRVRRKEAYWA